MKRAFVLLAACQPQRAVTADMPANAPHAELRACTSVLDVAWTSEGCRSDRVADADGDGVADCMRVVVDARAHDVHVWAWPKCTGEPLEVVAKRDDYWLPSTLRVTVPIELPPPLRSPAWVRAIAEFLVGADHVHCERATPGCAAPDAAFAWLASFRPTRDSRTIREHFEPRWQDGELAVPPIEALVLAPDRQRFEYDDRALVEPSDNAQLLVLDPRAEDLAPRRSCPRYETFGSNMVVVRDRQTAKWMWAYIGGARAFDAGCRDDLVLFVHTELPDSTATIVVRPDLGTMMEVGTRSNHWDETLTEPIMLGTGGTANATPAEVSALLVPGDDALPPCADGPLVTMPAPCIAKGRGKVRDAKRDDCWTATPIGNRATGVLAWKVRIAHCDDDSEADSVDVDLTYIAPGIGTELPLRWLAEVVVGRARLHCAPAVAGCPAPSFAAQRLKELYNANAGGQPAPLHWSPGSPAAPTSEAVLMGPSGGSGFVNYSDLPGLVLVNLEAPAIENRPPQPVATCGALELWTSPEGVAVRDPKRDRWAWLWIAGAIEPGFRASPIVRASCEADVAVIELRSGALGVVELATGKPAFFDVADVGKLRAAGDANRAKLMHAAIVLANDPNRPR